MKRPLPLSKTLIRSGLCALAAGVGFTSYVTLVSLLIQKNLASHTPQPIAPAAAAGSFDSIREARQADFMADIIRLHAPESTSPRRLAELIVKESSRANIDPLFVAAVIKSESMFRQHATSSKGARGLMQLMPATGRYVSEREKIALKRAEDLHDPSTNLRIGIAYLKYLEKRFRGDRKHALIAYNWGPANLSQSLLGASTPPQNTLMYAQTILSVHRDWSRQFTQYALNLDAATKTLVG